MTNGATAAIDIGGTKIAVGLVSGALVPLLIGQLGDLYGLRAGMTFLYFTFGCVLSVGFWAKPLINNAVIRSN